MEDSPDTNCKECLQDNKPNNTDDVGCPWYINSPEHGNCLWVYIASKSGPDGSMPELVQSEIAKLLGWSNTKTHFMLKQAMNELIEALKKYKANQFISDDDYDQLANLRYLSLDQVNYTFGDSED